MVSQSDVPGSTVLGPVNRVSFFDEQKRRRAQTWRYTAACGVAAAIVGIPLATFVTAFVFLLTILTLRLLGGFVPVPAEAWNALRELALVVPTFLDGFADSPDTTVLGSLRSAYAAVRFPLGSPALTAALLLVPSMATVVIVWLLYRGLFMRAGVGSELLALGAREPRLDDLEEKQLVNLVEEMAIAAGLPPPRVRLLDTPDTNAAAVGNNHEDAVIVVSRGTLDQLDRAETQAIVGHLVGSIGNGDMRIALSITTLFQTIELFFTAFEALFNLSRSAWRDLFLLLVVALRRGSDERSAATLARLMDHRLGEMRDDGVLGTLNDAQRDAPQTMAGKVIRKLPFLYVVALPFLLLYLFVLLLKMQVMMFRLVVVGPLVMMMWRTRRYLADATAVQLTRHPDALAKALLHLGEHGTVVPGGQWFSHLFIVGPEAAKARKDAAFQQRLATLHEQAAESGRIAAGIDAVRAAQQHAVAVDRQTKGTWSQELAGVASHPAIAKRVRRLDALGAQAYRAQAAPTPALATGEAPTPGVSAQALEHKRAGPAAPQTPPRRWRAVHGALAILMLPLLALAGWLMFCVMVAIFLFGAVSATFFLGLAMRVIHAVLL